MVSYRFGGFVLEPEERVLRRAGEEIELQDLPLRLLVALIERAPALVTREELREVLWPPGIHLDVDASLNTAVARVREALGDEASSPRFVATVPRRGYKFVAAVERGPDERRPVRWSLAAAAVLTLIVFGVWLGRGDRSPGLVPAAEPAPSAEAVRRHILLGRHHADRRSRDGLERAIAAFQSAVALDPTNAEAYSGLASSYALLGIYDYWRPRETFGPAGTMAKRALELDPSSAEAHLATGLVAALGAWDWETSLSEVGRALELSPESADVWYWHGALLGALGRHEKAIASTEAALGLAPTSPVISTALAWRLFQARRGNEAIVQAQRAIALAPDYYDAWDNLKWIHITLGHEVEAAEAWIRAEELDNGNGEAVARCYEERGLEGLHQESVASKLDRFDKGRYQSPFDVVLEYVALGEVDEALRWLRRSFDERETDLVDLAVDPRLDRLRGDSRFEGILVALGFPAP